MRLSNPIRRLLWRLASPTRKLIWQVKSAISYERDMDVSLRDGNGGFAGRPFMPAALHAYEGMLSVLRSNAPITKKRQAVHAEMMNVVTQHYYGGAQFQFVCRCTDEWLATTLRGEVSLPSLFDAQQTDQLDALTTYGPPTQIQAILLSRSRSSGIGQTMSDDA